MTATAPTTMAPAKPAPSPLTTLRDKLEKSRDKLAEVAPKYLNVERLTRLMVVACTRTPKILECTPESVLQFAMKCAETGLEPIGPGGAWPIPYGKTLTFVPDYRGLVHCAKRSNCIVDCYAEVVHEADDFDYELGLDPKLTHKPARSERGELQAAYCVIVLPDGERRFVVMHRVDIEAIRRRSKASGSGPWVTDESEMWKKTVVRRAMKPFVGLSSALDAAIDAADEADGVVANHSDPVPMPKAIDEPPAVEQGEPAAVAAMASADQVAAIEKLAAQQGALNKWRKYLQELYGIAKADVSLLTADQAASEHDRLTAILNGGETS